MVRYISKEAIIDANKTVTSTYGQPHFVQQEANLDHVLDSLKRYGESIRDEENKVVNKPRGCRFPLRPCPPRACFFRFPHNAGCPMNGTFRKASRFKRASPISASGDGMRAFAIFAMLALALQLQAIYMEPTLYINPNLAGNLTYNNASSGLQFNPNITLQKNSLPLNSMQLNDDGMIKGMDMRVYKGPLAYVCEGGRIAIFDTMSHSWVANITPAHGADEIALSPDGSVLYVLSMHDVHEPGVALVHHSWITAINTSTNEEIWNGDLGYMIPRQIAVSPDGKVYFTWHKQGTLVPGYDIFDFEESLRWTHTFSEYQSGHVVLSYAFNHDGSRVFMSTSSYSIIDIDWNENKAYSSNIYPEIGAVWSITTSPSAELVYFSKLNSREISYLRTTDFSMQRWDAGFTVREVKYNPVKKSLFAIGMSANGRPVLHRYDGLMGISSFTPGGSGTPSYMEGLSPGDFYTHDAWVYLDMESGYEPGHMQFTPDGKYVYITNIEVSPYSEWYGNSVLVYDTQTLFPAKIIKGISPSKWSGVAIAGSKVLWEPAAPKKNATLAPLLDGVYENFIGEVIFASFNSSPNGSGEGNGTMVPLLNGTGFGRVDAGLKLGSPSKIIISGLAKAPIGWVPRPPKGNTSGVLPGDPEISPGSTGQGQGSGYGSTEPARPQGGINGTVDNETGYAKNSTGNGIGQAETPSGENGLALQPEHPGSDAGGNRPLQAAQAQPSPQKGLLEEIAGFIMGLFGWQ